MANTQNKTSWSDLNMSMQIINTDVLGFYMGLALFWFYGLWCAGAMYGNYQAGNYQTVLALCAAAVYMVFIYLFKIRPLIEKARDLGGFIDMEALSEYHKAINK